MPQVDVTPTTTKTKLSTLVDAAQAVISTTRLQSHQSRRINLLFKSGTAVYVYRSNYATASPRTSLASAGDEIIFETQGDGAKESMHNIYLQGTGGATGIIIVMWED